MSSLTKVRQEASKRLALELKKRYNRLVVAGNDPDEVTIAAVDLGECFNENIEFVLWVLGTFGGLKDLPAPPHNIRTNRATVTKEPISALAQADPLPELPAFLKAT